MQDISQLLKLKFLMSQLHVQILDKNELIASLQSELLNRPRVCESCSVKDDIIG